jgi:hypothetical protein
MSLTEIGLLASAVISATAAALSAQASREALRRTRAPFIWPAIAIRPSSRETGQHSIGVRLHNDSPGVAFDVRFSLDFAAGSPEKPDTETRYVIPPVCAMRSGEVVPPEKGEPEIVRGDEFVVAGPRDLRQPWWVVVRYADAAGRRWEIREPADPEGRLLGPLQLRSARWDLWRRRADW